MHVASLLTLLLLPAVCQGTKLISLSTKNATTIPLELDTVDPVTGQFTKLFGLGVDSDAILRDDNTLVYASLADNHGEVSGCLITVDLSTGKVEQGRLTEPWSFFIRVAFDTVTKQTFVILSDLSSLTDSFSIQEVLPDQSLRQVSKTKFDFVDISAYSSSKHALFFDSDVGLVTMSTVGEQAGKVLYNVSVDLELSALIFDDTNGVLYAWGYDHDAPYNFAQLVSVDYTTGKILKTFFQSSTLIDASSGPQDLPTCIDKEGSTIYSFLYELPTKRWMIHTLSLSRGNGSQVPADRYAETMNCV